jgi:hypothetical protein
MLLKVVIVVLCLACTPLQAFSQSSKAKAPRIRSVSLRDVGRYANNYTPHTLKISNVLLEDVRKLLDKWDEYVLQLYYPRVDFRLGIKGEKTSFDPYGFLICVDELGKPLVAQREKWLHQRVTVYLFIRDMGLTTNMYVGYAAKIELLNDKGQVMDTLVSSRWP